MEDPAAMRRRLRVELRRLRSASELTQRQVADALDWSPSKVIRIESGQVGISVTDLRALIGHYGVVDETQVAELAGLARGSRRQPFADYRDVHGAELIRFFGYESSASLIRHVQSMIVPGLLQTEEYTRSVLGAYGIAAGAINKIVAGRLERQECLERVDPPEIFLIMDESVLRRQVGGAAVMRRQLEHLATMSRRESVSIQILPFSIGATDALKGPFIHLEFPMAADPDVLFLENDRTNSLFIDDPTVTGEYQETFLHLEEVASDRKSFPDFADAALRSFK